MGLNREELAWAAGFFDGEGCIMYATSGRRRGKPMVSVGQSTINDGQRALERFRQAVGGLGHINGPYKTHRQPFYLYCAHGFESTQAILAMLWTWLGRTKRAKGIEVLRSYHAEPGFRRYRRTKPSDSN